MKRRLHMIYEKKKIYPLHGTISFSLIGDGGFCGVFFSGLHGRARFPSTFFVYRSIVGQGQGVGAEQMAALRCMMSASGVGSNALGYWSLSSGCICVGQIGTIYVISRMGY